MSAVAKWHERVWEQAIESQYEEIKKAYGKKAADAANYGWGDASDGKRIDVATKVYAVGRCKTAQVLSSTADYPSDEVRHSWGEY